MANSEAPHGPFTKNREMRIECKIAPGGSASCPSCAKLGKSSPLAETVKGRWDCGACGFGFQEEGIDLVGQLVNDARTQAERNAPILYGPNIEGLNPEQKELINDAWANVATGRNNAGLLVIGSLVESALREVIEVHHNVSIKGGLHDLILYCEDHKLMDPSYLAFANEVRKTVRNLWQHQLVEQITAGVKMPVVQLETGKLDTAEGVKEFLSQIEEAKKKFAKGKVDYLEPSTSRFLQFPRKQMIEGLLAPFLYNQVWQWLLYLTSKYLTSNHYAKARTKHTSSAVTFKRRVERKGQPRKWKEFAPKLSPPFEKRQLPRFKPGPDA